MTPPQIELARHALGLSRQRRSYRNYFVAGPTHSDFAEWMSMVEAGDATYREPRKAWSESSGTFWLTEQGAQKALKKGETLCPEDFPLPQAEGARS